MHLNVCIVNAYAPPLAGPRTERWTELSVALTEAGHRVTWIRPAAFGDGRRADEELEARLQRAGVCLVDVRAGTGPALRYGREGSRFGRWVRRGLSELLWPDSFRGFVQPAASWIARHRSEIDVVLSSAMPMSDHFVGYDVRRRLGVPWIADYGDPWGLRYRRGSWRKTLGGIVEQRLLQRADGVIVTSRETARLFHDRFGIRCPVRVIPAGVPADAWPAPPAAPPVVLLQAGDVYGHKAPVEPFVDAYRGATRTDGLPLRLVWLGGVFKRSGRDAVRAVADEYADMASAAEVREAEERTHVAVVFGWQGGVQIPSKIWRALATGRPILIVRGDDDDALGSLPELRDRAVLASNDAESIRQAIGKVASMATRPGPMPGSVLPDWSDRVRSLERLMLAVVRERSAARQTSGLPAAALTTAGTTLGLGLAPLVERAYRRYLDRG